MTEIHKKVIMEFIAEIGEELQVLSKDEAHTTVRILYLTGKKDAFKEILAMLA